MGWISQQEPPCNCNVPAEGISGDIWQCDDCNKIWIKEGKRWEYWFPTIYGIPGTACGKGICIKGALHVGKCDF